MSARLALLSSLLLTACASAPPEVDYAADDLVLVRSARLRDDWPTLSRFAFHSWIDVKTDGVWHRIERTRYWDEPYELGEGRVAQEERWDGPVQLHAVVSGEEADAVARETLANAWRYERPEYRAVPGPNCNTMIEWILRETDGLDAHLPTTAVGKDYAFPLRAGGTGTGRGVELETPVAGVQLGLVEGVQLHLIGLTLGIVPWPPTLELPFFSPLTVGGE